jgi:hypothetical protein
MANRMRPSREVGSLFWFMESLKLDLEVLARALSQPQAAPPEQQPPEDPPGQQPPDHQPPDQEQRPPDGIAA